MAGKKLISKRDAAEAVIVLAVIGLVFGGLLSLANQNAVKWHDLGTVTDFKSFDQLQWNSDYQQYLHESWTIANVTTDNHGVLHFDSRGSCPIWTPCGNSEVSGWHLNQTLGIELTYGGWYLTQDP